MAILPLFGESAKAVAPMPYGALRATPSGKRKLDCVGRSCRVLAFGQDAPLPAVNLMLKGGGARRTTMM